MRVAGRWGVIYIERLEVSGVHLSFDMEHSQLNINGFSTLLAIGALKKEGKLKKDEAKAKKAQKEPTPPSSPTPPPDPPFVDVNTAAANRASRARSHQATRDRSNFLTLGSDRQAYIDRVVNDSYPRPATTGSTITTATRGVPPTWPALQQA